MNARSMLAGALLLCVGFVAGSAVSTLDAHDDAVTRDMSCTGTAEPGSWGDTVGETNELDLRFSCYEY